VTGGEKKITKGLKERKKEGWRGSLGEKNQPPKWEGEKRKGKKKRGNVSESFAA